MLKRFGVAVAFSWLVFCRTDVQALGAVPAPPSEPKMAVAPFGPPTLRADLRTRLEEAAETGLVATGAKVVGRPEVLRALGATSTGGCAEAECLKRLSDATGAQIWVRGNYVLEGNTYRVHLELFDVARSAVVAVRDDTCEICTEADAAETTNLGASALRTTWRSPARAGTGAATGAGLVSGSPALSAAQGGEAAGPQIAARSGGRDSTGTASGWQPSWRTILASVAFVGGAAAAGYGIYLVHEKNIRVNVDGKMLPKYVESTLKTWAIESFGASALLLGAGVLLLVLPPTTGAQAASASASSPTRILPAPAAISLGWGGNTVLLQGKF